MHPQKYPTNRKLPAILLLLLGLLIFTTPAFAGNDNIINPDGRPVPVKIMSGTATSSIGAAHVAAAQITTSTTAGTLIIARATRRSCLVRNTDAAISIYLGPATVTSGNGMVLKAGESTVITAVTLWQVIAASGSPVIAVLDEYD